jgi:hypothetical protein
MVNEALQAFLEKGGKITQCKPGPEKYSRSGIYKKDKQLKALKALADQVKNKKELAKIEKAIDIRIQILKVTF